MIEQVRDIISTVCQTEKSEINENTDFVTDLGLNSFELINLIIAFEDRFNVEVEDDELSEFKTVGDIVSYLEKKA